MVGPRPSGHQPSDAENFITYGGCLHAPTVAEVPPPLSVESFDAWMPLPRGVKLATHLKPAVGGLVAVLLVRQPTHRGDPPQKVTQAPTTWLCSQGIGCRCRTCAGVANSAGSFAVSPRGRRWGPRLWPGPQPAWIHGRLGCYGFST